VHLSEIITLTMLSSKIEIVTFIVLVFELNSNLLCCGEHDPTYVYGPDIGEAAILDEEGVGNGLP
jgi:hypothetical protein